MSKALISVIIGVGATIGVSVVVKKMVTKKYVTNDAEENEEQKENILKRIWKAAKEKVIDIFGKVSVWFVDHPKAAQFISIALTMLPVIIEAIAYLSVDRRLEGIETGMRDVKTDNISKNMLAYNDGYAFGQKDTYIECLSEMSSHAKDNTPFSFKNGDDVIKSFKVKEVSA